MRRKDVNEWTLLVVSDVELVDVAVEMPRLLKVDEARDAVQVLEVKDLKAVLTSQQPSLASRCVQQIKGTAERGPRISPRVVKDARYDFRGQPGYPLKSIDGRCISREA